LYLFSNI